MATLAPALRVHRDNHINVAWPHRDKSSDGWIGDASHQATGSPENGGSDHNENKRGLIDATDTDKDGIHVPTVIASQLIHPSTHYVIFNKRIMSSRDKFMPHAYTGPNPHDKHIHRSIFQSATAENRTSGYKFILAPMTWPLLRRGAKGQAVKELQAYMNGYGYTLALDGDFGGGTEAAVKSFQKARGLAVDGIVGVNTKRKLRPF